MHEYVYSFFGIKVCSTLEIKTFYLANQPYALCIVSNYPIENKDLNI
jgi:hypothetical protein